LKKDPKNDVPAPEKRNSKREAASPAIRKKKY